MIEAGSLPTEEEAREWAEYFVVGTAHRANALHLPGPRSTRDQPRPLCAQLAWTEPDELKAKDLAVFPPGHKYICRNCRERLTTGRGRTTDD